MMIGSFCSEKYMKFTSTKHNIYNILHHDIHFIFNRYTSWLEHTKACLLNIKKKSHFERENSLIGNQIFRNESSWSTADQEWNTIVKMMNEDVSTQFVSSVVRS